MEEAGREQARVSGTLETVGGYGNLDSPAPPGLFYMYGTASGGTCLAMRDSEWHEEADRAAIAKRPKALSGLRNGVMTQIPSRNSSWASRERR
jgi:hypothetical protein